MASTAAARPPPPGTVSASSTSAGPSNTNTSSNPSSSKPNPTLSTAQTPQITLLGTLPLPLVPTLLQRIQKTLISLPPTPLCEKETVLARHDDATSGVRETGDNAWASVVKARRGVKLRVLESLKQSQTSSEEAPSDTVECSLSLPLPSLPERQYPKASVRPKFSVLVLSDSPIPFFSSNSLSTQRNPFGGGREEEDGTVLGFDPRTALNTDPINGWKSLVSTLGWRPHFTFLRYGLSYPLNTTLSRSSTTTTPNPLNPSQGTKYTLNVYRIFTPDPTEWSDEWVPLDPEGSTVVVELVALVGGMVAQEHFNQYCTPGDGGNIRGGIEASSTIENAIDFADSVAKSLRGLVDLRREAYD